MSISVVAAKGLLIASLVPVILLSAAGSSLADGPIVLQGQVNPDLLPYLPEGAHLGAKVRTAPICGRDTLWAEGPCVPDSTVMPKRSETGQGEPNVADIICGLAPIAADGTFTITIDRGQQFPECEGVLGIAVTTVSPKECEAAKRSTGKELCVTLLLRSGDNTRGLGHLFTPPISMFAVPGTMDDPDLPGPGPLRCITFATLWDDQGNEYIQSLCPPAFSENEVEGEEVRAQLAAEAGTLRSEDGGSSQAPATGVARQGDGEVSLLRWLIIDGLSAAALGLVAGATHRLIARRRPRAE